MKDLRNLTNEEICNFLLNSKKADALQLSSERTESKDDSGFINKTIYKDKNVEIIYGYLFIDEDDIIQQFTIYSNWWGKVKNSFFTLEGFKGKSQKILCGVININDLKEYKTYSNHEVNSHNRASDIEVLDFNSFVAACQRKHGFSPSYEVSEVISQTPSEVKIKVLLPNEVQKFHNGTSKKNAANDFAVKFGKSYL